MPKHHHHHHDLDSLQSVEAAVARLVRGVEPLAGERVSLSDALGRVLAEDIAAPHDLPPFANSAMDGYAVRAADVAGAAAAGAVQLEIVGEAAAGAHELPHVGAGQAARITTGAPLPPGADAVVPVENTEAPGPMAGQALAAVVRILAGAGPGEFVRPAGQDVPEGRVVLQSGQRLRPQDLGMLAAVGVERPLLRRRPKVAILSTGDEVVEVGVTLAPGQIRDANGHMIAAFSRSAGADPLRLGIAADKPDSVREHLDRAVASQADLILSTAGVSMGAHDYVRAVLEQRGELSFWKVNIRPGKPLAFGSYQGVRFLGLPGNPVSAWVTFAVFVQPVLRALQGMAAANPLIVRAELVEAVASDGRESYLRARISQQEGHFQVRLTGSQDSGVLSSLVEANCLLRLARGQTHVKAGEQVEVWLMGEDGMRYVR